MRSHEAGIDEPFAMHPEGLIVVLRLTPKAARDAIEGIAAGSDGKPYVKARVRAVPADGAANAALVSLVAKWIGVRRGEVSIIYGAASRNKTLLVLGNAKDLMEKARMLPAGSSER
jgi:uncharacterized protein (TIGR00251 family)